MVCSIRMLACAPSGSELLRLLSAYGGNHSAGGNRLDC